MSATSCASSGAAIGRRSSRWPTRAASSLRADRRTVRENKWTSATISTAELRERLADPGLTIVDVRALAAYNGWRSNGEPRGGHVPGAVAFPSAWLTRLDDAEVVRLLRSKGIVPGQEIVLYGAGSEELLPIASKLAELGHAAVRVYEGGWAEWATDESLPVERLPNYQRLVHIDWLRQLLDGGR